MDVQKCKLPDDALLRSYSAQPGVFTDCYETHLKKEITFSDYVTAFYTTPLFKAERALLGMFGAPSNDQTAHDLAIGRSKEFSAWTLEESTDNQILMASGRTRSWFMLEPKTWQNFNSTRLLFGSAVVPLAASNGTPPDIGFLFRKLLPVHHVYSLALLRLTRDRLMAV